MQNDEDLVHIHDENGVGRQREQLGEGLEAVVLYELELDGFYDEARQGHSRRLMAVCRKSMIVFSTQ